MMRAAVYRGVNDVRVETVPVPLNADGTVGPGEVLVRIDTCGICGTDLKKIHTGSHSAPRIFGHEMAGTIAMVGDGVTHFAVGDRVMAYHHIPCGACYYCRKGTFAQCETYKKVGCTAGFAASGGGFAEYIRVADWIVGKAGEPAGLIKVPDDVPFEQAAFIEPVNTCFKAVRLLGLQQDETVLVIGQGPIGILLAALARRTGATVLTSDLLRGAACGGARIWVGASAGCARRCGCGGEDGDGGAWCGCCAGCGGRGCADSDCNGRCPSGRPRDAVCFDAARRGDLRSGRGVHGREDADGLVLVVGGDQCGCCGAGVLGVSRWIVRSDEADLASLQAGGRGRGDRSGVASTGGFDEDRDSTVSEWRVGEGRAKRSEDRGRIYADCMKATGLAARILYGLAALPAGSAAGFYATVWLLPKAAPILGIASPQPETEDLFHLGLEVGAIIAVPAFLCALTLPWRRRRHRRGRAWRLAVSTAIVVAASLAFAGMGHSMGYDLLFAAWLGCTLALTFVRYGLVGPKGSGPRFAQRYDGDEDTDPNAAA